MNTATARTAAALLVLGAALLVFGVSVERRGDPRRGETVDAHDEAGKPAEAGEGADAHGGTSGGEGTVLGVDAESDLSVAVGTVAPLAAATVLWITNRRSTAIVVGVLGIAFAVFDVAEVAHQIDGHRTRLAALAVAVAVAHAASAVAAGRSVVTARA